MTSSIIRGHNSNPGLLFRPLGLISRVLSVSHWRVYHCVSCVRTWQILTSNLLLYWLWYIILKTSVQMKPPSVCMAAYIHVSHHQCAWQHTYTSTLENEWTRIDCSLHLPRTGPLPASSIPKQHGSFLVASGMGDSILNVSLLSEKNALKSTLAISPLVKLALLPLDIENSSHLVTASEKAGQHEQPVTSTNSRRSSLQSSRSIAKTTTLGAEYFKFGA